MARGIGRFSSNPSFMPRSCCLSSSSWLFVVVVGLLGIIFLSLPSDAVTVTQHGQKKHRNNHQKTYHDDHDHDHDPWYSVRRSSSASPVQIVENFLSQDEVQYVLDKYFIDYENEFYGYGRVVGQGEKKEDENHNDKNQQQQKQQNNENNKGNHNKLFMIANRLIFQLRQQQKQKQERQHSSVDIGSSGGRISTTTTIDEKNVLEITSTSYYYNYCNQENVCQEEQDPSVLSTEKRDECKINIIGNSTTSGGSSTTTGSSTILPIRTVKQGRTPPHVDRDPTTGVVVTNQVAFIFLEDNPDATFLHGHHDDDGDGDDVAASASAALGASGGGTSAVRTTVPVIAGNLVTFPGNVNHFTVVSKGEVKLLGPFQLVTTATPPPPPQGAMMMSSRQRIMTSPSPTFAVLSPVGVTLSPTTAPVLDLSNCTFVSCTNNTDCAAVATATCPFISCICPSSSGGGTGTRARRRQRRRREEEDPAQDIPQQAEEDEEDEVLEFDWDEDDEYADFIYQLFKESQEGGERSLRQLQQEHGSGRSLRRRRRRREPSFSSRDDSGSSLDSLDSSPDGSSDDDTCTGGTGICLPF